MDEILFALWFFSPAGLATLMPVLAAKTPVLNRWQQPMDCGVTYKGKRLFGDNKTWRGLIVATLFGSLWFVAQVHIYSHSDFIREFSPIDYSSFTILVGVALSAGAIVGDAIGSFFKRQLDIRPGKSWFPFDQLDFIIGGLLLALPILVLPLQYYLIIPATWLVVHVGFNVLGYLVGFQKHPL